MNKRTQPLEDREVRLLTAFVTGKKYEHVLAHPKTVLTVRQRARLSRLIAKRVAGVPFAYLTGSQWFYGRNFFIEQGVLVPRPETEHLIEIALSILPDNFNGTIADIGTGSGCIGITLARERPRASIVLTDRSVRALRVTQRNITRFHVAQRTKVLRGNLLTPLTRQRGMPDIIIANLPYATPLEFRRVSKEPRAAIVGGSDGLAVYRTFFLQLRRYGFLTACCIIELDPRRSAATKSLAVSAYGKSATYELVRDLAGRQRVLVVRPKAVPVVTSRLPADQGVPPQPTSVRR